jgi:hypothetical protein
MQSSQYLVSFSYEKSAGFLLDKSCRKMLTFFSAVLHQQRKSDVMTSFGHSAHSTVKEGSPLIFNISIDSNDHENSFKH